MPTPSYRITCTKNILIAKDVYDVRFTKPEEFTFKGGQFVLFDVPLVENVSDVQPRAYSIASAPFEEELIFVIKMTPGGRASRWIEESLKVGDEITMKGPFGFFVLDQSPRDFIFIATSTGIAPFRSQILEAVTRGDTRQMDVIYGVRSEEDMFWREEMESIAKAHSNVHVHISFTAPSSNWTGHKGRVQSIAPTIIPDLSARTLFACGSPAMTKDVKTLALESWGMSREQVHVEGYM